MGNGSGAGSLVGRAAETRRLVALVQDAAAGRAGALLVSGEVGVGKTSLVREGCAQAAATADVLWASCLPLTALAVPFLPLRSALREWAGRGRPGAQPPPLSQSDGSGGSDAPVEFDAWLESTSRLHPVVLVVDDLQWADRSTLDVLMYVLAGPAGRRLAVIATLRTAQRPDPDPVTAWLADVRRLPGVGELGLDRLDRLGTRQQVANLLGSQPPESLVDDVFARARGNAYWTALLVRGLPANATSLPPGVPAELREAVTRTWAQLSPPARALTRLVALGGRPQPAGRLAEVAAAAGLPGPVVTPQREAVDVGVLVVDQRDRYWFGHPLLAEVLTAGMLPDERRAGHAAYALVLDRDRPRLEAAETELAIDLADHHFGAGHPDEGYRWALVAAAAAWRTGGAAEAIRLLRRALSLWDRVPDAALSPVEILDRIRAAAERTGAWDEELAAVDDLLAVVDRVREPLSAARLLIRRIDLRLSTGREFAGLADVREAVRLSAAELHSAEHALAMAELAHAELWHGVPSGPATADAAVGLARACGSPQALAYALTAQVMARVQVRDGGGVAQGEEAQRAAVEAGDWWAFVHALLWTSNCIDHYSPAVVDLQSRARATMAAHGAPHCYLAWVSAVEASGLLQLGEWHGCVDRLRVALGSSPGPIGDASARLVAAQLACWQGRQAEAEAHLARADEIFAQHSEFLALEFDAVRAALAVATGDTDLAVSLVPDPDATDAPPTLVERLVPLAAQALADRAAAGRDHGEDPGPTLDRLRALRRQHPEVPVDLGPGENYQKAVAAMQAWYDAEVERAEQAPTAGVAWRRAADAGRAALLPWDEAYARRRAAEALLSDRASRTAGVAALRRAHELASRLEAVPLLRDLEALATSARVSFVSSDAGGGPPPPGLPGLTPREQEVLAHLVAGQSYGEIARTLVISEKTVSVHVSNLLRKTGTTSRVELAQLARRTRPPT